MRPFESEFRLIPQASPLQFPRYYAALAVTASLCDPVRHRTVVNLPESE